MQDNLQTPSWSEARMSSVTILIPAGHRLDHEKDYNK